jgi:hypothetical protein
MDATCFRRNAENKARATVEVSKSEPKFGAGKLRIDRLVRIEGGFSRPKFPQVSHALSGGLAFRFFHGLSLTNFSIARGN